MTEVCKRAIFLPTHPWIIVYLWLITFRESEIDQLDYQLYDLTKEEIEIVENRIK